MVPAVWRSLRLTGDVTKEIGSSLGRTRARAGRKDISSPVGIVQASSERLKQGALDYLWVLGLISLSLALLNLLPLLPLDGGHIAFSIIEGDARPRGPARGLRARLRGRDRARPAAFFVGLSNDIGRIDGG